MSGVLTREDAGQERAESTKHALWEPHSGRPIRWTRLQERNLTLAGATAILPDDRRRGMFHDGDDPRSHEAS